MSNIKFIILGVILTSGLFLACCEAADGSTVKTAVIKLTAAALLATVPAIARWAGVSGKGRIARFLDED